MSARPVELSLEQAQRHMRSAIQRDDHVLVAELDAVLERLAYRRFHTSRTQRIDALRSEHTGRDDASSRAIRAALIGVDASGLNAEIGRQTSILFEAQWRDDHERAATASEVLIALEAARDGQSVVEWS